MPGETVVPAQSGAPPTIPVTCQAIWALQHAPRPPPAPGRSTTVPHAAPVGLQRRCIEGGDVGRAQEACRSTCRSSPSCSGRRCAAAACRRCAAPPAASLVPACGGGRRPASACCAPAARPLTLSWGATLRHTTARRTAGPHPQRVRAGSRRPWQDDAVRPPHRRQRTHPPQAGGRSAVRARLLRLCSAVPPACRPPPLLLPLPTRAPPDASPPAAPCLPPSTLVSSLQLHGQQRRRAGAGHHNEELLHLSALRPRRRHVRRRPQQRAPRRPPAAGCVRGGEGGALRAPPCAAAADGAVGLRMCPASLAHCSRLDGRCVCFIPCAAGYLFNLIDSPGHVDFCSEVSTAARLRCAGRAATASQPLWARPAAVRQPCLLP